MDMGTGTSTSTAMAAPTSSAMTMGGHDGAGAMGMAHGKGMGMGMGGCKISMLWNWNVQDACFISKSWHITSTSMFAGSCIGTVLLVIALEFLRRSVKEFDQFLVKQHVAKYQNSSLGTSRSSSFKALAPTSAEEEHEGGSSTGGGGAAVAAATMVSAVYTTAPPFRPSVFQQAIRALLHTMQFAVAYFIMLLAMYYNGYIIICIFIGAYLGSFMLQWETLSQGNGQTSAAREATVCCG